MTSLDELREKIIPILKTAGITKSALFGSYVRGEQTENSDVDILVEYPEHTSLFDIVVLKNKLERTLGKSVDLVCYGLIKPRIKQYILSEQIRII